MNKKNFLNIILVFSAIFAMPLHATNESIVHETNATPDSESRELRRWHQVNGYNQTWSTLERIAWMDALNAREAVNESTSLSVVANDYRVRLQIYQTLLGGLALGGFYFLYKLIGG